MKKFLMMNLLILPLLTSCGGSSSGGDSGSQGSSQMTSTFVDAAVEGLKVRLQDGTEVLTNSQGQYTCSAGETVSFWIGDLQLGQDTVCKTQVTPVDLVPSASDYTHSTVQNIGVVLQSLDSDGDPDTAGISIPSSVHSQSYSQIDLSDTSESGGNTGVPDVLEAFLSEVNTKSGATVTTTTLTQALNHLGKNLGGNGTFAGSISNTTDYGQTNSYPSDAHCPTGVSFTASGDNISMNITGSTEFDFADFSTVNLQQRDFSNNTYEISTSTSDLDYDLFCQNDSSTSSNYSSASSFFQGTIVVDGSVDTENDTATGTYSYKVTCGQSGNPADDIEITICEGTFSTSLQ